MDNNKICPRCGHLMSYDSYFTAYRCGNNECNNFIKVCNVTTDERINDLSEAIIQIAQILHTLSRRDEKSLSCTSDLMSNLDRLVVKTKVVRSGEEITNFINNSVCTQSVIGINLQNNRCNHEALEWLDRPSIGSAGTNTNYTESYHRCKLCGRIIKKSKLVEYDKIGVTKCVDSMVVVDEHVSYYGGV